MQIAEKKVFCDFSGEFFANFAINFGNLHLHLTIKPRVDETTGCKSTESGDEFWKGLQF